jgi:basic amino acid/polyamine antiporter, APA family
MTELKKSLGLCTAAGIGIGAITGTGIFVLIGVASGLAGPSVILNSIGRILIGAPVAVRAYEQSHGRLQH